MVWGICRINATNKRNVVGSMYTSLVFAATWQIIMYVHQLYATIQHQRRTENRRTRSRETKEETEDKAQAGK